MTSVTMAPRRRPREGVAEQATRQEAGDASPPQQTQPLPQDAHSGIAPPPPPPQVAQGLDMTRFLEGMAQFVAQHRDAPVPQGGTGKFLGQPDPDAARAWLDAVERTFRSMECVPKERVLLASYQLQAQALTWWSSKAFCPTYVRTERLYQFLDLQQRDFTVVQYRARFVELGRYAPQIMADEGLRTQQFVRGLRPEPRQALIVARVTDLDAAYQTAAALEADTLRTRARSAEPRQQQGSVQTTPRTATSYASNSTGTTAKSGSRRKFQRDRRQAEQRQQSRQQTGGSGGSRGRGRVTHLTHADAEAAHLVEGSNRQELDEKLAAVKILSWRQHRMPIGGNPFAAKFFKFYRMAILISVTMATSGRCGAQARDDEKRHEDRGEQQTPAPQGSTVLPPPPLVDYGVFMQGLVQAMQTQAHTQAALQAQAPAPIPQEQGHGGPSIMERFKRMAPPSFKGESQPLLVESWMREIEKIF
ncbi:hypothetical protein Taro_002019 [Colocasia esculenta]|uniref:Retrotransposon gag domain-containing protein n=1 Tax=Colocasia esculenta TaxID=4460 RepID=A0A843TJI5_COLES|nr:hypothetical protein [Colocasia esculenta]